MLTISRLLRPVAIGFGFGVTMVMIVAFLTEDSGDAAASNKPVRVQPAATTKKKVEPPNIDALVAEILERPLFSPSRQAADEAPEEVAEAPKEPPKMPGRLEGVTIRPEAREALFERDGQRPIAVKEGQEIDGWTVASIKPDQVLLKSTEGEQIVKPTNGAGIKPPQMQAMNKKPMPKKPNPALGAVPGGARPPAPSTRPEAQQPERPAQAGGRTGR